MENFEDEIPMEMTENVEPSGLWLSDLLLEQIQKSSRFGVPVMIIAIILGVSSVLLLIVRFSLIMANRTFDDFYLFEGNNLRMTVSLLLSIAIIYCYSRGIMEGYKSWQLLKSGATDDDALLEGTERLSKMFRWLTLWGGLFVTTLVLETALQGSL